MFVAQPAFGLERAEIELLQREDPDLAGFVARQERLVPLHVEDAVEHLNARCAEPAAAPGLDQFEPPLQPLVEKGGTDVAVRVELEVAVAGRSRAQADAVEEAATGLYLGA